MTGPLHEAHQRALQAIRMRHEREQSSQVPAFIERFVAKRMQPTFQYLQVFTHPEVHSSPELTIKGIVEYVAEHADERKQVILINGPLGAGKTRTRKRLAMYLRHHVGGEHMAYATAEMGLRKANHGRKVRSGFITDSAYVAGTEQLKTMIRNAVHNDRIKCILIEAPAMTGFKRGQVPGMPTDAEGLFGMNRGTTALEELFGERGELRDMVDIHAIGIVRKKLWRALHDRFEVAMGRRVRRGEGGSPIGMIASQRNIGLALQQDNYALARAAGIPEAMLANAEYVEQIAASILSWFYRDYLKLPRDRVLVCSNVA